MNVLQWMNPPHTSEAPSSRRLFASVARAIARRRGGRMQVGRMRGGRTQVVRRRVYCTIDMTDVLDRVIGDVLMNGTLNGVT